MYVNRQGLHKLVARVGEFYITDKAMKRAQERMRALLQGAGDIDGTATQEYVGAVRRYFAGFEREARDQLRSVDKRLEHVNQVHFNLMAERNVAVTRIEKTQSVLKDLAILENGGAA